MVTSENDSDEILTLDRPSITVRDHAKGRACCVLATGDFARANPLPYSKAIQIGTNICQTNAKPWNKESPISNSI
jgi:hypothetical protein